MSKMTYFEGANDVILRPQGTTAQECDDAVIHRGIDPNMESYTVTQAIQLNPVEIRKIMETGKIYIVEYGTALRMKYISVENPVKQGWVVDDKRHAPQLPNHHALKVN